MEEEINELEEERNITILSARDYGSIAQNITGPNSDKDIICLFIKPQEDYLLLGGGSDTYDIEVNGNDYTLWDIRKFASLMRDSNPTTIKFLKSNYEYYTKNNISEIINEIEKEVEENFNPVKLFQHYTKTAESQYYKYLSNHLTDGQERYEIKEETDNSWYTRNGTKISKNNSNFDKTTYQPTVKKTIMVVLNLLYSKHVLNNKTIPNHNVIEFLEETNQECLANILEEMIKKKKQGNKNEYIDENKEMLENIRNEIKNLEKLKEKPEVNKKLNTGNISIEKTNKYLEEIFHQIY